MCQDVIEVKKPSGFTPVMNVTKEKTVKPNTYGLNYFSKVVKLFKTYKDITFQTERMSDSEDSGRRTDPGDSTDHGHIVEKSFEVIPYTFDRRLPGK